jgi:hypothetical protein
MTGEVTMVFRLVRVVLALIGAVLVLEAVFGVPIAASDRAWGPAFAVLLGGVFGVWLVRVGINGTFSGNAPPARPSGPAA